MHIKAVSVTQRIIYHPECYLDYCQETGEEPTQEGFIEYIQDWIQDDFNPNYDVDIQELY